MVFFLSFVVETTWMLRAVLILYGTAFLEMMAMFAMDAEVTQDTRTVFALRRRGMEVPTDSSP